MKTYLAIALILLSLTSQAQTEIPVNGSASQYPLNIVSSDGTVKTIAASSMKGKPIILQWWAGGCTGSGVNLSMLNHLSRKFNSSVHFYAVSYDAPKRITYFQKKNNFNFHFLRDKIKMANNYFPATSASHIVIIDSLGKCLYRGHPSALNEELLEYLIANNTLPEALKSSQEAKKAHLAFHNKFKFADRKAGFRSIGFEPSVANGYRSWSTGLYFYTYNTPIYEIYRDGLFLSNYKIKISDSLKTKLSGKDTSNLYSVGIQLEKTDYTLREYSDIFTDCLNKAYKLNGKLVLREDSVIVLKGLQEGKPFTKSLLTSGTERRAEGDTIKFRGLDSKTFCEVLGSFMNMIFVSNSKSYVRYDGHITLDLKSNNRATIREQLQKQGVESEVKVMKQYFLEFL